MTETERKRRLQVHLSTAVVMMVVAGLLIWANVTSVRFQQNIHLPYIRPTDAKVYGWPCDALRFLPIGENRNWIVDTQERELFLGMYTDLAVALAILFATWFVCEGWIRRRAARRGM